MDSINSIIVQGLLWTNDHGIWDFLTFVSALSITLFLRSWYKRRIPGVSVHVTYSIGNDHHLYPNTLNFEIRNLLDSPLVAARPNFRFTKKLLPGSQAHGNSATGDYEIKFRMLSTSGFTTHGFSYTSIMLRHRENAFGYIPIDDSITEEKLVELAKRVCIGKLTLDVVLLKEGHPQVISMEIPVKYVHKLKHKPPLGSDGHPKAG